jgi:hypothetical protein
VAGFRFLDAIYGKCPNRVDAKLVDRWGIQRCISFTLQMSGNLAATNRISVCDEDREGFPKNQDERCRGGS